MAKINAPDVQDSGNIQPFNYSKSIEQPNFQSVTGALLKGASNLVEGIAKGGDEILHSMAKQEGDEFGQKLFDNYVGSLSDILAKPKDQQQPITPDVATSYDPASINTAPPQLAQDATAVDNAYTGASHVKPGSPLQALYYAQAYKGAKELEAKWGGAAGYGDVVRQQIEQTTGYSPSRLVSQLIAQINANSKQTPDKEEQRAWQVFEPLMKSGAQDSQKHYANEIWYSNIPIQAKMDWAVRVSANEAKLKRDTEALTLGNDIEKVTNRKMEGNTTAHIYNLVHTDIDTVFTKLGITKSGAEVDDKINSILAKGGNALKDNPEIAMQLKNNLIARANTLQRLADREANIPQFYRQGDPTPYTRIQMLGEGGAAKFQSIVDTQKKHLLDLANSIYSGDTSTSAYVPALSRHIQEAGVYNALTGPDAKFYRSMDVLSRTGVPNVVGPLALGEFLSKNNFADLYNRIYTTQAQMDMISQPGTEAGNWLTAGPPNARSTVTQAVDNAIERGKNDPRFVLHPAAFKEILGTLNKITEDSPWVNDTVRANLATAFFHPSNNGITKKFAEQGDVYTALTNPEVTKTMWRLGETKDRRLWDMYQKFFLNEFSEAAGPSVRELNSRVGIPWANITWDKKAYQFKVDIDRNVFANYSRATHEPTIGGNTGSPEILIGNLNAAKDNLNHLLSGFKTFSSTSGSDVQAHVYYVLKGLGMDNKSLASQFGMAVRKSIEEDRPQKAPQSPNNDRGRVKTESPTLDTVPSEIANFSETEHRPIIDKAKKIFNLSDGDITGISYGPVEVTTKHGQRYTVNPNMMVPPRPPADIPEGK